MGALLNTVIISSTTVADTNKDITLSQDDKSEAQKKQAEAISKEPKRYVLNENPLDHSLQLSVRNKEGEIAILEPAISNPYLTNIKVDASENFYIDEKGRCNANVVLEFQDSTQLYFQDFPLKVTSTASKNLAA